MECEKCKNKLEEDCRFCPNCGEKVKEQIAPDIGAKCIAEMEKILAILEKKKKDEAEKPYPCPHCNKEITIQSLKCKLNTQGNGHP